MKYEEYWPRPQVDMSLLAGVVESGRDLYLIGAFGGHGGIFLYAHRDLMAAKDHLKSLKLRVSTNYQIFKMSIGLVEQQP